MRAWLGAGACALAMTAAAVPADAYTYLTFEVIGSAYGTMMHYDGSNPSSPYVEQTGAGYFDLQFTVRTDMYASSTGASCDLRPFCSASASGNTIHLYQVNEPHHLTRDLDITLCLTGAATMALSGSGYLDPQAGCSSGTWRNADWYYRADYGSITSVDVIKYTSFYSATQLSTDPYSLLVGGAVAFTPEPATWATMLLGFAMAGAALRRRRGGPAVSASAGG